MNEVPRIRVGEYKKFIVEPVAETTVGSVPLKDKLKGWIEQAADRQG